MTYSIMDGLLGKGPQDIVDAGPHCSLHLKLGGYCHDPPGHQATWSSSPPENRCQVRFSWLEQLEAYIYIYPIYIHIWAKKCIQAAERRCE